MFKDIQFVRALSDFTAQVAAYLGPVTPENYSKYLKEQNRFTAYLHGYNLIDRGHVERFVLSSLKRLIQNGCGVSEQVRAQLKHYYGMTVEELMCSALEVDKEVNVPTLVLPVEVENNTAMNIVYVTGSAVVLSPTVKGHDLVLKRMLVMKRMQGKIDQMGEKLDTLMKPAPLQVSV